MPSMNDFYVFVEGNPFDKDPTSSITVNFVFFTGRVLRIIYATTPGKLGEYFTKHYIITENGKPFYRYTSRPESNPSYEEEGPDFKSFCSVYSKWFAEHMAKWNKEWFHNPDRQFDLFHIEDADPENTRIKIEFMYLCENHSRNDAINIAANMYNMTFSDAMQVLL